MHSKEEWVLVKLGSQHMCVERPAWSVFPDYLSVSRDYGARRVSIRRDVIVQFLMALLTKV